MKHPLRLPFLSLSIALLAVPAFPQADAAALEGPEAAASAYFTSLQNEGMGSIVDHMHPEELGKFKAMLQPVFEAAARIGDRGILDMTFGPEATIEEVQGSSPAQFMASFMRIIEAQLGGQGLNFDEIEVLGTVPEGEVSHVLTRVKVGAAGVYMTKLEVISFRRDGDRWGMMLTGQMEGIAQALRANLPAEPPPESDGASKDVSKGEGR
ncbi:MAG: hypothetical protein AAGD06_07480 [Acidobacteriota bacterium]